MELMIVLCIICGAVIFFVNSLVEFLKTDKSDTQLRQENKVCLIIASCILGVMGLAIVVLMILASYAVSHM